MSKRPVLPRRQFAVCRVSANRFMIMQQSPGKGDIYELVADARTEPRAVQVARTLNEAYDAGLVPESFEGYEMARKPDNS